MTIRTFEQENEWITETINFILSLNPKTIALSGGSTPVPIYKELHKHLNKELSETNFFQVDERYVPKNHNDSNYKLIKDTLFTGHQPKNFHYFDTSLPIEESLKNYKVILEDNFKSYSLRSGARRQENFDHTVLTAVQEDQNFPTTQQMTLKNNSSSFDLCILGIGPDGHTASLFPHSPALNTQEKTAHTTTNQFAIKDRLTLTFPPILNSKNLLVLLKNKPEILEELKNPTKTTEEFAALKLLEHKNLNVYSVVL